MDKAIRPQRIRRHSRKAWPPEIDNQQERLTKRLFTPEIKRMLKEWLIRRRENPYPSREEKKRLAIETGLTYTQICNWFANWRRKLKNSERQKPQSWGHLIKHYNTNARGNVEQFSISSEDSIWEEEEHNEGIYNDDGDGDDDDDTMSYEEPAMVEMTSENLHVASQSEMPKPPSGQTTAKYKHKMLEKYLRDIRCNHGESSPTASNPMEPPAGTTSGSKELSKWLESAAKFTPDKSNYHVEWNHRRANREQAVHPKANPEFFLCSAAPSGSDSSSVYSYDDSSGHHKDELEAAEALTKLAFNCRQKMLGASAANAPTPCPMSALYRLPSVGN